MTSDDLHRLEYERLISAARVQVEVATALKIEAAAELTRATALTIEATRAVNNSTLALYLSVVLGLLAGLVLAWGIA